MFHASLFLIALILYSIVILTHRWKGELTLFLVCLFGLGLTADIIGTISICILHTAQLFKLSVHSVSGWLALLIMSVHFVWAVFALNGNNQTRNNFHKYSILAWAIWLISFFSGIPTR